MYSNISEISEKIKKKILIFEILARLSSQWGIYSKNFRKKLYYRVIAMSFSSCYDSFVIILNYDKVKINKLYVYIYIYIILKYFFIFMFEIEYWNIFTWDYKIEKAISRISAPVSNDLLWSSLETARMEGSAIIFILY